MTPKARHRGRTACCGGGNGTLGLRAADRYFNFPSYQNYGDLGFRCVRD